MQTESIKPTVKDHRLATRVTGEHKSLFERAAALKGVSLSDFVISATYDAAIKVLAESQIVLELGPDDSRAFVRALLDSRTPDELPNLQAAIEQIQQRQA